MPLETRQNVPPTGLSAGLHAFAGGIGFIITTPSMWLYSLVPTAIAVLLTVGLSILGIWGTLRADAALFGDATGLWPQVGSWSFVICMSAVALVTAIIVALCLAQPLSGFALEKIVYAQERALVGESTPAPPLLNSMLRSVWVSLITLLVGLPILAILFAVNFFFPPAAVVTVPVKFLVCAWLLAWNFLDYPLGVRRYGIWARLLWVARNFDAFTMFGLAWAFLVIVPGVVLLVLPMGVAGATRLAMADELNDHSCQ